MMGTWDGYWLDEHCGNCVPHTAHGDYATLVYCPGVLSFARQQARWKAKARATGAVLFVGALVCLALFDTATAGLMVMSMALITLWLGR